MFYCFYSYLKFYPPFYLVLSYFVHEIEITLLQQIIETNENTNKLIAKKHCNHHKTLVPPH